MLRPALAPLLLCAPVLGQGIGPQPDRGTSESPAQVLTGTVTDGKAAVAGATVHLVHRRYPLHNGISDFATDLVETTATTGAGGRFRLPLPPWRVSTLYATHAGKVSRIVDEVASPAEPVTLRLTAASSVTGRLRYRRGAPDRKLAFRLVRVTTTEKAVPLRVEGTTAVTGGFRVDDLPPGSWRLKLAAGKYRLPRPVVLEPSQDPVTIDLAPAVALDCRVVSRDGARKPLAGARVELLDPSHYFSCTTDSAGRFRLEGVEDGPGASVLIETATHGRTIAILEPGLSPDDPAPQATLAVPLGADAVGRIVDMQDRPWAGGTVLFKCTVHISGLTSNDLSLVVRTDAEGHFETHLLEPTAMYEAIAMLPGGEAMRFGFLDPRPQFLRPDLGTYRLGSRRVEVDLRLPDGKPQDVSVRLYGPLKSGDLEHYTRLLGTAKGTWLSPALLEGEYCAVAASPTLGMARSDLKIMATDRDRASRRVVLSLPEPKEIQGVVVGVDGQPVENALVTIIPHGATEDGGSSRWSDMVANDVIQEFFPLDKNPRQVTTKKDGRFALWCFEASGQYDVLARHKPDMKQPQQPGQEGVRIEHVLSQPLPLRINLPN